MGVAWLIEVVMVVLVVFVVVFVFMDMVMVVLSYRSTSYRSRVAMLEFRARGTAFRAICLYFKSVGSTKSLSSRRTILGRVLTCKLALHSRCNLNALLCNHQKEELITSGPGIPSHFSPSAQHPPFKVSYSEEVLCRPV